MPPKSKIVPMTAEESAKYGMGAIVFYIDTSKPSDVYISAALPSFSAKAKLTRDHSHRFALAKAATDHSNVIMGYTLEYTNSSMDSEDGI